MKDFNQIKHSVLNILGGAVPGLLGLLLLPRILLEHGSIFLGVYMLQITILFIISLTDLGISRVMLLVVYDEKVNPEKIAPPFIVAKKLVYRLSIWLVLGAGLFNLFLLQSDNNDISVSNFILLLAGFLSVNNLPHRGVLEIKERFFLLNVIRAFSASSVYFAPLLFNHNTSHIFSKVALVLLMSRIIAYLAYYFATSKSGSFFPIKSAVDLKKSFY